MTRAVPYPETTRAKGWRFELDHERIEQSDTWALAAPEVRPWLLMLWMKAWQQAPCGSLPNDDELIAARIGMPVDQFTELRPRLLRGWWVGEDGRLYHDFMTTMVLSMLDAKDAERNRKAEYRRRMEADKTPPSGNVPRDTTGTPTGPTPDSVGSDDTGTSTGTGTSNTPSLRSGGKRASRTAPAAEIPGVLPETVADWLQVRTKKRAGPITETVMKGLEREAGKAGITLQRAVEACCEYGWQGFAASWYLERQARRPSAAANAETPFQRSMRERVHEATGGLLARRAPNDPDHEENGHAPALATGNR